LDNFDKALSVDHIQKQLEYLDGFEVEKLSDYMETAVREVRHLIKNELKKRISKLKKDLKSLLEDLSIAERKKVVGILENVKMQESLIVVTLIQHFCQALNDYETALSEAEVYKKLFGEKEAIKGKLAKSRTETLKILRRFIALETANIHMGELEELIWLQRFFLERGNTSQYLHTRNNILRRKTGQFSISSANLYQYFLSESLEHDMLNNRNEVTNDQNLWETLQSLDEYYLVERLWYTCHLLNLNQTKPLALPPQKEWLLFDIHAPHLRWFFEKPLGKLFALALQFLSDTQNEPEKDMKDLLEFIQLLHENENIITKELISSFEIFAINYGLRRTNRGNLEYTEVVFDLQQRRADTSRCYTEGMIAANEFQSIAIMGLYLGKYDWVRDFIEKNKEKVLGSMPSIEYYQFCRACYLYNIKDLLQALTILSNADFDDIFCKMASRILEVKILCELQLNGNKMRNLDEELDARIDAGILFFFRLTDVPPHIRTMRKRFMEFMKKIIRAKENQRWALLEKIKKEVVEIRVIAEGRWLLKIIDQYLEQGRKKV
jgi:hypothetical protein